MLSDDKCKYAAIDVFYLLDLFDTCSKWVDHSTYQLDKAATSRAFEFQTNGLHIDRDRIKALRDKNQKAIDAMALPINVNSWQQVRPYIGEDESDGLALATFALEGNDKARNVQTVRKLIKLNSFLDKFERLAVNDRIYGKFAFTTKSGRGNCKDQNLQQLPRKTKSCFGAEDGNVLVMSDFAQLELRMFGAVSGDLAMAKAFKDGVDLHQYTADTMGVPRQQAKTCNFNLTYGGSANMLRSIFIKDADILLPIADVQDLKKKWHKLWVTGTEWQQQMAEDWQNGVPQSTSLGRKFISNLYTDAMNLPIQGRSADVAKLAMHKMFKALHLNEDIKGKVRFCNFVHDSFMWECPDDPAIYKPLALITANAMKEAWNELVVYTEVPDMPMPVDVTVGHNWGDLEYEVETPQYSLTI